MKKLLIMIIAAVMFAANINNVSAKINYYEPTHVVKMLQSKGYTFNTPDFGGFAEYSYKLEGKNVTYTDVSGYLRGVAHAYDIVTKTSETSEYFKAFEKDFDNLAYYLFEYGSEFSDPQTAFIEAFMMYCLYEDEFEKECSSLHDYIKNNVMKFKFDDVSEAAWYRSCVEDVYYLGLMTGVSNTLFKPNATMNRGMVATVLHRMSGSVEMDYFPFFSDLSNNQYYTVPVIWCYSTGIIHGYSDNTFKPLKSVTREEMVTMLYNFAKYKNVDVRGNNGVTEGFKDYNQVSQYAKTAMNWAVTNGIITGKDNGTRLDPKGTATRAECAKMLVKLHEGVK